MEQPDVLTVTEAARILRVSPWAAYEAIKRDELPHLKIGHRIIIPRKRLEALLAGPAPQDPAS